MAYERVTNSSGFSTMLVGSYNEKKERGKEGKREKRRRKKEERKEEKITFPQPQNNLKVPPP